jgi:hypothetical protein
MSALLPINFNFRRTKMATFSNLNLIGVPALQSMINKAADVAVSGQPPFAPLTTSIGGNLKLVYGKATATLSSGLATCAISAAGDVTASGGTYKAPTVTGGMVSGDYGWFSQASAA